MSFPLAVETSAANARRIDFLQGQLGHPLAKSACIGCRRSQQFD
jgi:hypothetical protein